MSISWSSSYWHSVLKKSNAVVLRIKHWYESYSRNVRCLVPCSSERKHDGKRKFRRIMPSHPLKWHYSLPFVTIHFPTHKLMKNSGICFIPSLLKYKHVSVDIKLMFMNYKLIDLRICLWLLFYIRIHIGYVS